MDKSAELSPSLEDYLEAIALLQKRRRAVRVKDVSRHLGVNASSVNSAVQTLSQKGLVTHEHYGYIELTQEGEKIAGHVQRRHDTLLTFLTKVLCIPQHIAVQEACAMEHHIRSRTLERLSKLNSFALSEEHGERSRWLERFHQLLEDSEAHNRRDAE
ncbi:hypothetical protein CSB45_07240 [candidate division KSB3 bacterium]|uniref:HTH dtxR-type domain-containing protein n=1 Tax=candidate division KSB3 bacterium TaxID=2044937 RepID=A0A2G6E6U1_9BACT|nr:MAG: hypothetical protein CSB45_07240 [candidate division KSB3 bacterium]PIE29976.1 MAG: hypothetical protein CSA57_05355 [candidate division KSB3 bacterium]